MHFPATFYVAYFSILLQSFRPCFKTTIATNNTRFGLFSTSESYALAAGAKRAPIPVEVRRSTHLRSTPATPRSLLLRLLLRLLFPLSLFTSLSLLPILYTFLHPFHEFAFRVIVIWPRASALKDNDNS